MLTNSVGASSPVGCIVAREPEAAGDSVLPSGTNGLQARQEARDFRRGVRRLVPCQKECASEKVSLSSDGRKSKRVTGLSSEAAGLRSEFFKPSGKPSTSRISLLRQGKARCALSSSRSLSPLQKCRPLRSRHLFRGRAERRDCFLRCTPGADSHSGIAPLPVMPGLDAPGTSVRPLRLRD